MKPILITNQSEATGQKSYAFVKEDASQLRRCHNVKHTIHVTRYVTMLQIKPLNRLTVVIR